MPVGAREEEQRNVAGEIATKAFFVGDTMLQPEHTSISLAMP